MLNGRMRRVVELPSRMARQGCVEPKVEQSCQATELLSGEARQEIIERET